MSVWTDKTRASLIRRVKDTHDELSWRDFVTIYDPLLYRYARLRGLKGEAAREVVQECFAMLAQKMPKFDYAPSKGSFKGWLRRVANNKINDMFRRQRPISGLTDSFDQRVGSEPSAHDSWEDQWRRKHQRYCLKKVLEEASTVTRRAFELYVVSEWPVERVCESLEISADQVYAAKSRIRKRLRQRYHDLFNEVLVD